MTFELKKAKQTDAEKRHAYQVVTERDQTCQAAGILPGECVGGLQRDHRQNRDGFNTVPSNLQLLCAVHHSYKSEHPAEATRLGLAVSRYEVPARVRVRRVIDGRAEWVYLDNLGFVWEQEVSF